MESYYWVFSTAAQSIAALIAFLIAGVALAFSMMDRLVDQDDTLYEIVASMKKRQYEELIALAIATGTAIIFSLIAIYINPINTIIRDYIMIFASVNDVIVIVIAVFYVGKIINPNKYEIVAKKEYAKIKKKITPTQERESAGIFFKKFIDFERDIRKYISETNIFNIIDNKPNRPF